MKTADHVLLALALSLSVLGLALTLARLRQISTQLAVLTLRVTDLVEAVAELGDITPEALRAELDREP